MVEVTKGRGGEGFGMLNRASEQADLVEARHVGLDQGNYAWSHL